MKFQALLKKHMMNVADQTILLADASKFGVRTFTHITELPNISLVITNGEIEGLYEDGLKEKGIQVQTV